MQNMYLENYARRACKPTSSCKYASRCRKLLTVRADIGHQNTQAGSQATSIPGSSEMLLRSRRKARSEVLSAGVRVGLQAPLLEQQFEAFESLLPNLFINLDQMRASDWARVVADLELGAKLVLIKTAFPRLNVEVLLRKHPRTLLWSRMKLQDNLQQVCQVFDALPRPEEVLEVLPELLDPAQCFSVVATLRKWFPKRDPLEVLQSDPDVIRRAEQWDVPLEPMFFDRGSGSWTVAGYSRNKQEDWQVYIEREIYKRKPQAIDKMEVMVVGGSTTAAGNGGEGSSGGGEDFRTDPSASILAKAGLPG